ncbi:unnamed protein product [Clonostachys rosea f. rosea IK726]|uniref:Uncharacterized protein n=2 Tax=Clonostachys rosea f. rosea IK726 TaxID=1349383 RepID=A0ACA9UAJ7_BIOOC|nr:unnamed protein product [Clonostachys rosea f. rosea IK726]CAG9950524.1 unnamed protein product [Clonostachys rosea f. rosea IK726]
MCLISLFSFRLNSIPGFNRGLSQPLFNNLYFLLFIVANVRERLRWREGFEVNVPTSALGGFTQFVPNRTSA